MPHDTAAHHLFSVEFACAARHECHGARGVFEIVCLPCVPRRNLGRIIFHIRKIDVDVFVQRLQYFNFFVRMGIVDDGNFRSVFLESLQKLRNVVGGGHEIDVFGAHVFQFAENADKGVCVAGFTRVGAGDFVILAEHAPQGASAEKDGARTFFSGNTRFLERVQTVFGDAYCAVRTAGAAFM